MLEFTVNGNPVSIEEQPGEMLSDLLRLRLGLTGTKIACQEDECGACTVLLDGEPVLSCSFPAAKAHKRQVVTIEGLADYYQSRRSAPAVEVETQKNLHPLQDAFIQFGSVQCGFCIPGQIMTSAALLEHNPDPSEAEIKYALKDTLCRCAGYPSILGAVQAAAKAMRNNLPVEPPSISQKLAVPGKAVGRVHPRADAVQKVTGQAVYTDDIQFEGMLQARVKRAMIPAGVLRKLDVSKARALPGVVAVLTAADVPGENISGLVILDWPVLVGIGQDVRTVGDAVAIVAAETREIATQALDLIEAEL